FSTWLPAAPHPAALVDRPQAVVEAVRQPAIALLGARLVVAVERLGPAPLLRLDPPAEEALGRTHPLAHPLALAPAVRLEHGLGGIVVQVHHRHSLHHRLLRHVCSPVLVQSVPGLRTLGGCREGSSALPPASIICAYVQTYAPGPAACQAAPGTLLTPRTFQVLSAQMMGLQRDQGAGRDVG